MNDTELTVALLKACRTQDRGTVRTLLARASGTQVARVLTGQYGAHGLSGCSLEIYAALTETYADLLVEKGAAT